MRVVIQHLRGWFSPNTDAEFGRVLLVDEAPSDSRMTERMGICVLLHSCLPAQGGEDLRNRSVTDGLVLDRR